MLCYRGMTFCPFHKDCADAPGCPRPLTGEVQQAAQRAGLPISRFGGKPDCHVEKTLEGDR